MCAVLKHCVSCTAYKYININKEKPEPNNLTTYVVIQKLPKYRST